MNQTISPSANIIQEKMREVIEPVIEPVIDSVIEQVIEPVIDSVIEPVIDSVIEPVIDSVIEPVIDSVIEQVIEPVIDSVIEQVIEPVIDSVIEPVIDSVIEPVIDSVIEPVIDSVIRDRCNYCNCVNSNIMYENSDNFIKTVPDNSKIKYDNSIKTVADKSKIKYDNSIKTVADKSKIVSDNSKIVSDNFIKIVSDNSIKTFSDSEFGRKIREAKREVKECEIKKDNANKNLEASEIRLKLSSNRIIADQTKFANANLAEAMASLMLKEKENILVLLEEDKKNVENLLEEEEDISNRIDSLIRKSALYLELKIQNEEELSRLERISEQLEIKKSEALINFLNLEQKLRKVKETFDAVNTIVDLSKINELKSVMNEVKLSRVVYFKLEYNCMSCTTLNEKFKIVIEEGIKDFNETTDKIIKLKNKKDKLIIKVMTAISSDKK
jgi:hypothetical protein